MRKVIALLFLQCFIHLCVNAQTTKTAIAIFPFRTEQRENRPRAYQLQQLVSEVIKQKLTLELIDRSYDSMVVKELDFQIRDYSMGANGLVKQGKLAGAKQMLVGTLSNISVERKNNSTYNYLTKTNESRVEYSAVMNFTLQLVDVESGKVLTQKSFSSKDSKGGGLLGAIGLGGNSTSDTEENAIALALKKSRSVITAWLNESFPTDVKIIRVEERDKNGFPETVLLTGLDGSLTKGAQIVINEVENIDIGGKTARRSKKIGALKVKEIQGEITVCKVSDGEKVLEEKLKNGTLLEFIVK